MSNPCRRARRLVRSMRESSALVREHDVFFCYRHQLPWLTDEVYWLEESPLVSEDDLRNARQLAFRLPSDLHRPLAEMQSHRLPKAAARSLRQAYDNAIALCEALETTLGVQARCTTRATVRPQWRQACRVCSNCVLPGRPRLARRKPKS
jgi:hypothetical protein